MTFYFIPKGTPPPLKQIKLDDSALNNTLENGGSLEFNITLKSREYQLELAEPGLQGKNYIFVAPTGSGKTLVAVMVIAKHLKCKPNSRVAFIVPTKPLADHQMQKLKKYIPDASVNVYTGGEYGDSEDLQTIGESKDHISVYTAGKLLEEIKQGRVKFSQFSMLVMDEYHHTVKEHAYAKLMKLNLLQLDERLSRHDLQIIGMTASLGAGSRSNITDHLKNMAAHLDATGGIVSVKNPSDLGKFNKEPSRTTEVLTPRDSDQFIGEVIGMMNELQNIISKFKDCDHTRWSQEYETLVVKTKQALETSTRKDFRDHISTLSELQRYCTALSVYMDFRKSDAIKIMKRSSDLPDDDMATPHKLFLKRRNVNSY